MRRRLFVLVCRVAEFGNRNFLMSCRLCGRILPLVKAHVIPEAFFRELRERDGRPPLIVTGHPDAYNKKSPIGVYDSQILCRDCEAKVQRFDDYGIDVLLRRFDTYFIPVLQRGIVEGFSSETIDQNLLLGFLVSVLWRASVSVMPFFRRVNLGPHLASAARILQDPDAEVPAVFGAVLVRWNRSQSLGSTVPAIMDPFRTTATGVNGYRVYFGDTMAEIKVDQRPYIDPLASLALGSSATACAVVREYDGSKDIGAVRKTVATAYRRDIKRKIRPRHN